jgi:hypothetical protein
MNDLVEREDVKAVLKDALTLSAHTARYAVRTHTEYIEAGEFLTRTLKVALEHLDTVRRSITRPLDEAKKNVMYLFADPEQKLRDAEQRVKAAMRAYRIVEDERRRKMQDAADERARRERERLQQRATNARSEEQRAELEAQAQTVVAPIIQLEPPKVAGISAREVWKFEVTDEKAVPRVYCSPDAKKIRAVVEALKGETDIAGVRVWKEEVIAAQSLSG